MEFSSVSDIYSNENNQNLRSLLNEFKDDIIKQITNHVSIKSNTDTGIANVNPNLTKPFTSEEYINLLNKDLPEIFESIEANEWIRHLK